MRAPQWKRQAGISIILNSPMTIRPLTSYEWESNMLEESGIVQHHSEFSNDNQTTYLLQMREHTVEETGRDQHHSQFPNDNQTTYSLWMREQYSRRDRQGSASFSIPQWQSDHLLPMNERATQWERQAGISIILNSPMTIRPLTPYEWESNTVEKTDRDQYHSKFPNDNQTTYKLWMREHHSGRDRQGSASFWIPQWQSDHLQTMNKRAIQWKRQTGISIILNSPMTIRPLTNYEWESNTVEETAMDQHHFEFPNDNQTTYKLWMREQHSRRDRQGSASLWVPQWQSDHLPSMNERAIQWKRQAGISIILNSQMTIRPLTSYEWESNTVEETGRNQYHSKSSNDNQITYRLWMREQHSGRDRQGSTSFWIPQRQSDHLHPIYISAMRTLILYTISIKFESLKTFLHMCVETMIQFHRVVHFPLHHQVVKWSHVYEQQMVVMLYQSANIWLSSITLHIEIELTFSYNTQCRVTC